jgi:hypothetical protein
LKRAGDIPAGSVKREGINIVVTAGYVESQTIELPLFDYSRNKNVVSIDEGWVDDHYEVEVPEASIKETEATVTISEGYIPEQKIFYKDTGSGGDLPEATVTINDVDIKEDPWGTLTVSVTLTPGEITSGTTITKQFEIVEFIGGASGEYYPGRDTQVIEPGQWINSEIVFYGLPEVNVTADKLLKGSTAINTDGEVVTGTYEGNSSGGAEVIFGYINAAGIFQPYNLDNAPPTANGTAYATDLFTLTNIVDNPEPEPGPEPEPTTDYLTFTANENSTFKLAHGGSSALNPPIKEYGQINYRRVGSDTWTKMIPRVTEITLAKGMSVELSGNYNLTETSMTNAFHFQMTGSINATGNVRSIGPGKLYGLFSNCDALKTAPVLPDTTLTKSCYAYMFENCSSLIEPPVLNAKTLAESCYLSMFEGCSSLKTAPALPAAKLATTCYSSMFTGCTSITQAPTLPATTAVSGCYMSMFAGCSSLTEPPVLPATKVETACYSSMFTGCTSLKTAPALPATGLKPYCYHSMFAGCSSLTTAPTLPATTLAEHCYHSMFLGCSSLTTAPTLPATTLAKHCYAYMFEDCPSLTEAPTLPAFDLVEGCYVEMFKYCSSLSSITVNFLDWTPNGWTSAAGTSDWVKNVSATGIFRKYSALEDDEGDSAIPTNWTIINIDEE